MHSIQSSAAPQRAPTGYFTSTCIEKARQNGFGGLLGTDFLKITFQCTLGGETRLRALLFSPPNRFWRAIPCLHASPSAPPQAKCKKTHHPYSANRANGWCVQLLNPASSGKFPKVEAVIDCTACRERQAGFSRFGEYAGGEGSFAVVDEDFD